jgi:hypothetical protein
MVLKSTNGRQKHHTQAGLHVCCELALKSAGTRNTHGGTGTGNRLRERSSTSRGVVEEGLCVLGRISWLRRVRLENPLGHGKFSSGLKLSGERDGGLGLARFLAVCPLGGHMCVNGLLWHAGMAGAACMGLTI